MTTSLDPPPTRAPNDSPFWRQFLRSIRLIFERARFVDLAPARLTSGEGTPEGNVTGNVGDLYTRTDGGAGTVLYVKETGTGDTGWSAK